jgi:hypothetical protein
MKHIRQFESATGDGWSKVTETEAVNRMRGQTLDTFVTGEIKSIAKTIAGKDLWIKEQYYNHTDLRMTRDVFYNQWFLNVRPEYHSSWKRPWRDFSAWFDGINEIHRLVITSLDKASPYSEKRYLLLYVVKSVDDYYFVHRGVYGGGSKVGQADHYNKYYVCDGLDGLMSLLSEDRISRFQ